VGHFGGGGALWGVCRGWGLMVSVLVCMCMCVRKVCRLGVTIGRYFGS